MRFYLSILLCASGLILAGCAVGPDYERPKTAVKNNFGEMNASVNTNPPATDWWKTFHDPELDKLVTEALRTNYDLQVASARLRQSRYQRNYAAADLFPEADADAGYAVSRGSKNVKLSLGGSGSGSSSGGSSGSPHVSPKAEPQNGSSGGSSSQSSSADNAFNDQLNPIGEGGLPGETTQLYQAGFDASWEIDIFGGKRRSVEAAEAEVQVAVETRRNLVLTLLAEVARDYLELRGTQQRLQIAETNLAAQNQIFELTRSKQKAGLATDLDVRRAAAQTATTASALPPLQADIRHQIHALSILLAQEPDALSAELETVRPVPVTPPEVPIGLPSQLIERRPDIREAERQMAAANARIGNATADLFPKFALVATTGLDSSSAQNLFDWESRYFLLSPTVTWRIFDAGRVLANIGLQKANKAEADLQYRSQILKAMQEVEDALIAYATEQERHTKLVEAFTQNQQALLLVRQQYDHGLVTFVEVLVAEENTFSAQDELTQSTTAISTDLVALYKALGGGWN